MNFPQQTEQIEGATIININTTASGRRRHRALGMVVQNTLSKTSMLSNFLPTGTLLTFEMTIPSIHPEGACSHVAIPMMVALLALCALLCFLFHFTDSFVGRDNKVYYGFVTPYGLAVFEPEIEELEVLRDRRYMLGLSDFIHAFMSLMVFMAIAFTDYRVTNCLFPGHEKEIDEMRQGIPLMVGIICSCLFLIFPNTRHGVGCMAPGTEN